MATEPETLDFALQAKRAASARQASKLQIRPEPTVKYWPHKHRSKDQIAESLKANLNALIRGELAWPLFLWGNPGTGKTCAVLALCDHCPGSWFMSTDEMTLEWNNIVSNGIDADGDRATPMAFRQRIRNVSLLAIDDCGTREKVSASAYELFKACLDLREGKPLIVTSNHPLERIEEFYDARIKDRFEAGTVVELKGESRRGQPVVAGRVG